MAISLVQQTGAQDSSGAGGSVSKAFASNNTAGNMLYAVISQSATTNQVTSFHDTLGNTWTNLRSAYDANTTTYQLVYVAYNCKGGANTVSFTDGGYAAGMIIGEVSGLATSAAADKSVYGLSTLATPSVGPTSTLSVANEFILALCWQSNTDTLGVGTGYSNYLEENGSYASISAESKIVSSTTGVSATFTGSTSGDPSYLGIVTFKAASGATNYTSSLTDSASPSEVFLRLTSKFPTGTITPSEVFSHAGVFARALTDSISPIETFLKNAAKAFSETVSEVENLAYARGRLLTDSISQTEVFIRSTVKTLVETISPSEVFSYMGVFGRSIADSINPTETITKLTSKVFSSSVSLAESFSKLAGKAFSETISLVETIVKSTAKFFSETITIIENFLPKNFVMYLQDTISPTETLTKVGTFFRHITDSISPVETLSFVTNYIRSFIESITLVETFQRLGTFARNLTDTISLSEAFASIRTFVRSAIDSISPSESITFQKGRNVALFDILTIIEKIKNIFTNRSWGIERSNGSNAYKNGEIESSDTKGSYSSGKTEDSDSPDEYHV